MAKAAHASEARVLTDIPSIGKSIAQDLLARSLHGACYQHNPGFLQLMGRTGLPFKSFDEFKKASFEERYAAYQGVARQLWSLGRLQTIASWPKVLAESHIGGSVGRGSV